MKKILLHACCGPCSIYPLDTLRSKDFEVYGLFYNPNIHPYTEFKKRRDQLAEYAQQQNWQVIFDDEYRLDEYLQEVVHRESRRCQMCYNMRLRRTAQIAKKGNFDAFSSTLLVSPFQKHELIRELGENIAEQYDIPFYYEDFRPGFKEATIKSKELEMYRQQYCGCIYSERDRYYRPQKKKGGK
ncbi:epoxyqueuosine reductase QueH [Desulfotomaculum defluvii]